ncbi:MAG: ADP-ribosylglycohydrolase family protein [Planctomycetes bacterium]|nr:ADP-ribosylglycohydrolase family protein [Planctomycetota bacterium]
MALIVLAPLAISIAVPLGLGVSTMLATPNVAVDYRHEMRARQEALLGVDGAEAAWRRLVDVLDRAARRERAVSDAWERRALAQDFVRRDAYDIGMVEWNFVRLGPAIPVGVEREIEALAAMEADGVFDDLATMVGGTIGLRPSSSSNDTAMSMTILEGMPVRTNARGLATALAASMRLALAAGDEDELVAAFAQLLILSETIGHQRSLLDSLVGTAIVALALRELRHELDEAEVGDETCQRLAEVIRRYRQPPLSLALEGERASFHDFVQRAFSDDGSGDGHLIPRFANVIEDPSIGQLLPALRSRFLMGTRREHVTLFDEVMDEAIAFTRLPIEERAAAGAPVLEPGDSREERRLQLVWIMLPAIGKTLLQEQSTVMDSEATVIMLAIERFENQHGRPPAALEELVPEFLPAVPTDPLHGGPFGYRLLADDPAGRAFVLYSFGADGNDDWPDDPVWRNRSPNDIVLNRPRDPVTLAE